MSGELLAASTSVVVHLQWGCLFDGLVSARYYVCKYSRHNAVTENSPFSEEGAFYDSAK